MPIFFEPLRFKSGKAKPPAGGTMHGSNEVGLDIRAAAGG